MFIIEDEIHAELHESEFNTFEEALSELKLRATISWDQEPNCCPCISWRTCERNYQIVEYNKTTIPWKELKRTNVLNISAKGIKWIWNESKS